MRLCEHAVGLRLTTLVDVLDSGLFLELVTESAALGDSPYRERHDLSGPRRPRMPLESAWLDDHVGAGFHQSTRWALHSETGERFELHAHLHPYTGVYVTQIEWRVPKARFEDSAFTEAVVDLARRWAARTDALSLHAHDVDDDGAQNCDNAMMLRLGYGVEVDEADYDVNANPGREFVRGHFRFVSAWLTYYGADALRLLERAEVTDAARLDGAGAACGVAHEPVGEGRWYRLYASPLRASGAAERAAQSALRDALGYDRMVKSSQRVWGYWQRK